MAEKSCPLCGKTVRDNEKYCDDCLQMAKDEFPAYIKGGDEPEEITSQDVSFYADELGENDDIENKTEDSNSNSSKQLPIKPSKSAKKSVIFIAIGLILLVAVGGVGSYKYKQEKDSVVAEVAFWEKCLEENTPLSYSKYLVRYPEGQYNQAAQDKIIQLRQQEQDAWDKLQSSNKTDTFLDYLEKHPDSPYRNLAKEKMDSVAWVQAKNINTTTSYTRYLQDVDSGIYVGKYVPMARTEYDYLSQLKKVEGEALKGVKKNMTDLAKFLSTGKYESARKLALPILTNYFGDANKDTKDIVAQMKSDIKENKIKNISYSFHLDSIAVVQDNANIFIFDMPVTRKVTFIARNKRAEELSVFFTVKLNENKLLQSVFEKK